MGHYGVLSAGKSPLRAVPGGFAVGLGGGEPRYHSPLFGWSDLAARSPPTPPRHFLQVTLAGSVVTIPALLERYREQKRSFWKVPSRWPSVAV